MEQLKTFFLEHEEITTKNVQMFVDFLRDSLNENENLTMNILADRICGENSFFVLQTMSTKVKNIMRKINKLKEFQNICIETIEKSFWKSSNPNFQSANNFILIFGKEVFFESKNEEFLVFISSGKDIPSCSKLIEPYLRSQQAPIPISSGINHFPHVETNSYSILGSYILDVISNETNFETIYSLTRALSEIILTIININDILNLYSETKSPLLLMLKSKLNRNCFYLFLSITVSGIPEKSEITNSIYNKLLNFLSSESSIEDKIFGYVSLMRLTNYIQDFESFVSNSIAFMILDFDSRNANIHNSLENLYLSIIKRSKKDKTLNQLGKQLYLSVEQLSYQTHFKSFVLPDIITFYTDFPSITNELIELSQDASDCSLVNKCIKSFCKNNKLKSENLIKSIIEYSVQHDDNYNFKTFVSIFQPFYNLQPQMITKAFELFNDIKSNSIKVWLRLETLSTIPKSKWPNYDIYNDLKYGIRHCNYDLKLLSFQVLLKTDFLASEKLLKLITKYFIKMIYCDSSKHIQIIFNLFNDFINIFKSFSNKEVVHNVLNSFLNEFVYLMAPDSVTTQRKFGFDLTLIIWKHFPNIYNETLLHSIYSLLFDPSTKFSKNVYNIIYNEIYKKDNKKAEILRNFGFKEQNDNKINVKNNEETLNKYINELKENNSETIHTLERFLKDKTIVFTETFLNEIVDKFFDVFINTKDVGISYHGQFVFESLFKLINNIEISQTKLNNYTTQLLTILSNFDMENMRRSASLPFVALSLIRIYNNKNNDKVNLNQNQIKILNALINLLKNTSNEIEATNTLNVIRFVLKDKITSSYEETFLPKIFQIIFETSEKFHCWDFISALNLCFATLLQKLWKRSEKTINLMIFFQKFPNSKEILINALKSINNHTIYFAITVLSLFNSTKKETEILNLLIKHIDNKSSRIRRLISKSIINVIPESDYNLLYEQIFYILNDSKYFEHKNIYNYSNNYFEFDQIITSNSLNTFINILKILIIEKQIKINEFPQIKIHLVPPFIYSDLILIYNKLNMKIPKINIKQNSLFYYDESILLYNQNEIICNVSDSLLISILNKSSEIKSLNETFINIIKNRIAQKNVPYMLLFKCIDFLYINKIEIDSNVLFDLIYKEMSPEILANLINSLKYAKVTDSQILKFIPFCEKQILKWNEENYSVHLAISNVIDKMINFNESYVLGLLLLINDVPKTRLNTAKSFSLLFDHEFMNEIELFELLISKLSNEQLKHLLSIWLDLIEKRNLEKNREILTFFVDEFFVVRKVLNAKNIKLEFEEFMNGKISEIRNTLVEKIKSVNL